jgi:hypothetical protein
MKLMGIIYGTILSLTFEIGKYRILSLYQSRQSSPSTIHYFIQGVSAKTVEPNNSVIFQRIFVKFKMQIF